MNTHVIANNAAFAIIDIAINEFHTRPGEHINQNSIASKFQEYGLDWDTANKGLLYAQENGWLEYKSPNIIINQSAFDEADKKATLERFLNSHPTNFSHTDSPDAGKYRLTHSSQDVSGKFSIYYDKSWSGTDLDDLSISVSVSGVRGISEQERKIPAKKQKSGLIEKMIHSPDENLSEKDLLISKKICEILNFIIGNRDFPVC